jgi:TonB family protein
MDASRRSLHIYGKTESGKNALTSARGALSSAARQLLILIDGRRTLDDLSAMLGAETLERSLEQLEAQGHVALLRHFPESDESLDEGPTPHKSTPAVAPAKPAPAAESPRPPITVAPSKSAAPTKSPEAAAMPKVQPVATTAHPEAAVTRSRARWSRRTLGVTAFLLVAGAIALAWPQLREGFDSEVAPRLREALSSQVWPRLRDAINSLTQDVADSQTVTAAPAPAMPDRPIAAPAATAATKPPSRPAATPSTPDSRADAGATTAAAEASTPKAATARTLQIHSQFTPQISQQAKDLGITAGRVEVVLFVSPHGGVERVELVSATPPEVYDDEMRRVFEKWTFEPPGVPGRMTVRLDIGSLD